MRLIKTKLATVLVLSSVMFGAFSFSTTRIAAQDTSSAVSVATTDDEKATAGFLFRSFIKGAAWAVGVLFVQGFPPGAVSEYPTDALD